MNANEAACDVGQLALDMVRGYAAHSAAIRVASRLDGKTFVRLISANPIDSVPRKDGTEWSFETQDSLIDAVVHPVIKSELPRVWLAGSLLALGDALKENDYFGHLAEFELVRHLRNGIAHGNRFEIRYPNELKKYPAHNRDAFRRSPNNTIFEITPALDGKPVLFDFMGAGDVLDLLSSVGLHLKQMGQGEPSRTITEAERQELIKRREELDGKR